MSDIEKLKELTDRIQEGLDYGRHHEVRITGMGCYGDEGHVGDDDEDVVGMMWIEETLPDNTVRVWNVRVKLDD